MFKKPTKEDVLRHRTVLEKKNIKLLDEKLKEISDFIDDEVREAVEKGKFEVKIGYYFFQACKNELKWELSDFPELTIDVSEIIEQHISKILQEYLDGGYIAKRIEKFRHECLYISWKPEGK